MSTEELASKICSMPDCDKPPREGQRYCRKCHGKYMKAWRARRRREEMLLRKSVVTLRKRVVELQQELKLREQ